jgi:hypothetical protein
MLDFGPVITSSSTTSIKDVVPVVQETVRIVPVASQGAAFIMKSDIAWGWSDLRDYVVAEIEKRHGPQVRDARIEASVFKSFMSRWPEQSVAIAKAAFGPVHEGMWCNAPISVNRFCKASDSYFAAKIAERL